MVFKRKEKGHRAILRELRGELATERIEEIEYGMKEFIQGLFIGFVLGFIIAAQLVA